MHIPISKGRAIEMRGKGVLLNKIKIKPLPMEVKGGAILSNRIVGITSNAVSAPPSNTMATMGGALDFSKHVKRASQNLQKKSDKDQNIKFVF